MALAEPAVATDPDDRVVAWNDAAAALFGVSAAKAMGRYFQEVLDGHDVFGNRTCRRGCNVHESVRSGEPVQGFEMDATTASGKTRIVVLVETVPGTTPVSYFIVYHLQPDRRQQRSDRRRETVRATLEPERSLDRARRFPGQHRLARLTTRETEILQLLGRGSSTPQIARVLGIRPATVRNHTQNLLQKLGVHSRLEAVSLAVQNGLI